MILQNPYMIKATTTKVSQLTHKYNLFQIIRYGLVGVCAASAHALVALAAFHLLALAPTLSNFSGFVVGALVSYLGSYYFTFKSEDSPNSGHKGGHKGGHSRMILRFLLVWLIGIAINVGLFKAIITAYDIPFVLTVFIAIALTPIAQYLMLKFWAFRD